MSSLCLLLFSSTPISSCSHDKKGYSHCIFLQFNNVVTIIRASSKHSDIFIIYKLLKLLKHYRIERFQVGEV